MRSSFSCSIFSIWMAKHLSRSLFRSGRSAFAFCYPIKARLCTTAITRSAVGRPSTTAPAPKVEGIVSKRVDAPYAPGNRGLCSKSNA